ncbi:MAG: 4Fe-4S binding protein [Spirochaetaceae bacterium]|jgi:ferredoxin|nr:4Fe-4S binding protein [Spirochaetaceae bacterium]
MVKREVSRRRFCEIFSVPDIPAVLDTIDLVVRPPEQDVVLALGTEPFTAEDADSIGGSGFTANAYRRGVFSLEDRGYRTANYYTRLEIFAVAEPDVYRILKTEQQRELDSWYFDAYYRGLAIRPDAPPTVDAVLSLGETLDLIENEKRQAYLVRCDCRSLAAGAALGGGPCEKPLEVCVSFRAGPNSLAHRGISRPVSKDEAKQAVLNADSAGLMHTANETTICNCCTDCCYLSRARKRRNAELGAVQAVSWPRQTKRVSVNPPKCLNCAVCVDRCPFGLFSLEGEKMSVRSENCVGCGLCVNTCPGGALELRLCRQ